MQTSPLKVFGVVGWKNSGKTTLVEALVREFVARGLKVATVKHAHHAFDIDVQGTDSYRHRKAGAQEVIVSSDLRWALMHENMDAHQPGLETLLSRLSPCDLVLVEGFKSGSHHKIETARFLAPQGLLADSDTMIRAVATTDPSLAGRHIFLDLNNISAIADFIAECVRAI